MELKEAAAYRAWGLGEQALQLLALLGDRLLAAENNVSGIRDTTGIEHLHFLDSLALCGLREAREANTIADVGSGGGLPALVLAIALPGVRVTAIEATGKKCAFIEETASRLGLTRVGVYCGRAEAAGQGPLRESFDVVVSRALAAMPVVLEYSLPLTRVGGSVVAMKGPMEDQECIRAQEAAHILGGGTISSLRVQPFPDARNRWLHVVAKVKETPRGYPRRIGLPAKRPLGSAGQAGGAGS